MEDEKKALTPEEIAGQLSGLLPQEADFFDADGNFVTHGSPNEWLISLIREYGEQQREIANERVIGFCTDQSNYCKNDAQECFLDRDDEEQGNKYLCKSEAFNEVIESIKNERI